MNILFVSDLAGMGGGEVSLLHIMEYLSKENSVYLLCRVPGTLVQKSQEKGIKVFCYDFKKNIVQSYCSFRKIIKENRIDVVHNNELTTAILHGVFAKLVNRNVKNFCTCHGQWYKLSGIKRILIQKYIRHIFCVSAAVEENLRRQNIVETSVSYLGVPEEKFCVQEYKKKNIKNELGLNDTQVVVSTIGRFQKIKGQLNGVQTIKNIHSEFPDIVYFLIGDNVFASEEDEKYKQQVIDYIRVNNMEKYVKLLGEREDIPELMAISDYVMITSDNESFGMVAIETIASGKILISTPCDGVVEILENDLNMISKTNDVIGLTKVIKQMLYDIEVRNKSIKKIESLKKKFTVSRVCEKYLYEYKKM